MNTITVNQNDLELDGNGNASVRFAIGNIGITLLLSSLESTPTVEPEVTTIEDTIEVPKPVDVPAKEAKPSGGHPVPIGRKDWLGHCQYRRAGTGKWGTAIIIDTRNADGIGGWGEGRRQFWLAWLGKGANLKTAKVAYKAYGKGGPFWVYQTGRRNGQAIIKNVVMYN